MSNNNRKVVSALRNSAGKFCGLYTKQGESINAKFCGETPSYVKVIDNRTGNLRTISKKSLVGLRTGGAVIGAVS